MHGHFWFRGVLRNQSGWSGFGQTTISQGKNKIPFYKKQVINKSARVIFGLVRLVIYSTVGRKAISKGGKLLAAHAGSLVYAHKIFCCAKVSNRLSASVILMFHIYNNLLQ